jgi:hypothetical protein
MKLVNKKILTLALVVVMMVSVFAVGASAIDPGEYIPSLDVDAPVPHTLDFFDGLALVETDDGINTITIKLLNPVTITVTPPYGSPYVATGKIVDVEVNDPYEIDFIDTDGDGIKDTIIITGPANQDPVIPIVITFSVDILDTEGDVESHRDVPAKLILTPVDEN